MDQLLTEDPHVLQDPLVPEDSSQQTDEEESVEETLHGRMYQDILCMEIGFLFCALAVLSVGYIYININKLL